MHLFLNSRYVQVFLSVSQNTFSQRLILIDHNNRKVTCPEEKHNLEKPSQATAQQQQMRAGLFGV